MLIVPTKVKLAFAGILYFFISLIRSLMGSPNIGVFNRGSYRWELDLSEGIDFSIFIQGCFEPEVIKTYKNHIKEGDIVIDIGANIGAHTIPLADLVGFNGKVVAVEPTVYAFTKLKRNLELNAKLTNRVEIVHAYLASNPTDVIESEISSRWPIKDFSSPKANHGGVLESTGNAIVTTLDDYILKLDLKKVDWLKLDVDGNELKILMGAKEVLQKLKPNIIMEIAPSCHRLTETNQFSQMITLLSDYEYEMKRISNNRILPLDAKKLLKIIPANACINVILKRKNN